MESILDPSLVLSLPLYDLDGVSFVSRDALGHPCTVTGAMWTPRGRNFDGADDVISASNPTALSITGPITVEAWAKPNSAGAFGSGRIMDKWELELVSLTNAFRFSIVVGAAGKSAASPAGSTPFGLWSHIVGVFDGNNVLIYTNLEKTIGDATSGPINDHSGRTLHIGNRSGSDRCFDGLIGEFRVHNRALTPLEIQRNYLATKWRYR